MNEYQTVQIIWLVIAGLVALAVYAIIKAYSKTEFWKKLFDFSQGNAEIESTCRVLRAAIAASATDDEFRDAYKRMTGYATDFERASAFSRLERQLMDYRRGDELGANPRTLAARYADDLARRYEISEPAPSQSQSAD